MTDTPISQDDINAAVWAACDTFRGATEGKFRHKLIEENLLDTVIGLPEKLFYGTGIPAAVLVFRKQKADDKVLFIDASRGMSKKTETSTRASESHIAVFQEQAIRRIWHKNEWWFAIVDVVAVLTGSVQPEGYVKDLRRRDKELAKGWGQIATPLRPQTEGGIQQANYE